MTRKTLEGRSKPETSTPELLRESVFSSSLFSLGVLFFRILSVLSEHSAEDSAYRRSRSQEKERLLEGIGSVKGRSRERTSLRGGRHQLRSSARSLARTPAEPLIQPGSCFFVRLFARSRVLSHAARLERFKMSPMAVTGSIFNHVEISAGGSPASTEPDLTEGRRRKGGREEERKRGRERGREEGRKKEGYGSKGEGGAKGRSGGKRREVSSNVTRARGFEWCYTTRATFARPMTRLRDDLASTRIVERG